MARRPAKWGSPQRLLQLQIVQNEPVAVVGYAQAVRGFAIRGSSEVGADPGCQPGARVGAFRKERPIQRAKRGVHPVQVAAAISREEAVGDSDLIDSQPGIALQVQGTIEPMTGTSWPLRTPSP